jgi:murein peptide amidase A
MSVAFKFPDFQTAFREAAEAAGFTATTLMDLEAGALVAWELPGNGPRVYLSAGIHGDEPAGPLALLELLRTGFFATADCHWWLCPALNPSGLSAATRENASGVDLNRDYWLRGTPEIIAHALWLDALAIPDLFISLHEDWESAGFYFYEINLGTDDPDRARHILDAVRPWFPPEPGPEIDGHDSREPGWIYHAAEPDLPQGWPEAIYLANLGCPLSFTFETPSHAGLDRRIAAHVAAVAAVCEVVVDGGKHSE